MNVKLTKLNNGTKIITSSLPYVESVTMGIWVKLGGRYETPETAGISHFIEHLMFKGTKKRSPLMITQDIEGKGGYLNAFTQEESTCYYSKIVNDRLDCAMDVLSDMYMNSVLDSREIERERGVIIEEIMMYRDQPHHVAQDLLTTALWNDHPLGMPVIGWPVTVSNISRKTLKDYINRYYVPSNTVFAFAGNL